MFLYFLDLSTKSIDITLHKILFGKIYSRNYLFFCFPPSEKMLIMMVKVFSGHQHTLASLWPRKSWPTKYVKALGKSCVHRSLRTKLDNGIWGARKRLN